MRNVNMFKIDSIDLVCNAPLEDAFEAKKRDFRLKGIPSHEVLAFHGTPVANIDSICRTNLQYTVMCHYFESFLNGPAIPGLYSLFSSFQ